jgi:hypothetical protein
VVELEAVPFVPGVTHGLTVVPGAAPGVVVAGEAVEGIGDAVCDVGVAVCGVGVAVLLGDCVLGAVLLGDVVTAGPGFAFGFAGFCPAVVPGVLEPAVPVCAVEGVAVWATSLESCMAAVCPVFAAPQ